MNINYIIITKKTPSFYADARKEYEKRLSRFCRLKVSCVKNEEKAEKILNQKYPVITLNSRGSALSSEEAAEKIRTSEIRGVSSVNIVVGEDFVLPDGFINAGSISVTHFPLSSDLTAVTGLEQIYRAYKIISGETYHK